MLPSIVASEVKRELQSFLISAFPITTETFSRLGEYGLMERFLAEPNNLFQGPWLEVKMPFRTMGGTDTPLKHFKVGFPPYLHQLRSFERLSGALPESTIVATVVA